MSFIDRWAQGMRPTQPQSRYQRHDALDLFTYGGNTYPLTGTTWGTEKAEAIGLEFISFIDGALKSDGIVYALEQTRLSVFSEARFLYQRMRQSRPGDLWGDEALQILERPWPGGTTGDLLARMVLDADLAGNSYWVRSGGELVRLRPDWVEIILDERQDERGRTLPLQRVGYIYYHGGKQAGAVGSIFQPNEVCHFAPSPDPSGLYRGMSWLTPVVREIQSDIMATKHKLKFFENAATPNLHVGFAEKMNAEQLRAYKELMDESHAGADRAYKTLYTAGGADVTVLGADMRQMDFKATQGAGETRLAAAAGVHPVIAGLSEGMQGSSLNAGNYQAAKRVFIDKTIRPLWRNAAGSLETLIGPPSDSRLWYDDRDIPFLREDVQDRANVQQTASITIRNLVDAGYTPESVKEAITNEDMRLLDHSGLFSVQLQPANSGTDDMAEEPDDDETEDEAPRAVPMFGPDAIHVEVNVPERQTIVEVDAHAEPADVTVNVPEREVRVQNEAPVVNVAAPEMRAIRKTVETDDIGRITAVYEEPVD